MRESFSQEIKNEILKISELIRSFRGDREKAYLLKDKIEKHGQKALSLAKSRGIASDVGELLQLVEWFIVDPSDLNIKEKIDVLALKITTESSSY